MPPRDEQDVDREGDLFRRYESRLVALELDVHDLRAFVAGIKPMIATIETLIADADYGRRLRIGRNRLLRNLAVVAGIGSGVVVVVAALVQLVGHLG